ncbi:MULTISPECIES: hypothetical protein [Moorena]|nr:MULTISPECIES: hypothetical protein [Moorena]NEP34623.1 hypothetical protein [Moorena sp. SIO3B2]NEP64995.1 hypothetical protein [Moorena sp. SIO3A5]NEQ11703.1 hypothetical protein [Moorena sp. SIO4E2]
MNALHRYQKFLYNFLPLASCLLPLALLGNNCEHPCWKTRTFQGLRKGYYCDRTILRHLIQVSQQLDLILVLTYSIILERCWKMPLP